MAEKLLLRALHHLHDGQRLAIPERDGDAFDLDVAFEAVERDAGERGAHLEMTEAFYAGGVFDGGEDQRAETLAGEVGMHKDGADLGSVGYWVEQFGFTVGAMVCAEEGFAFGPSAAACQALPVEGFGDKISTICDELRVDAQDGAQRALDLRGRVVVCLQATYRSFNQLVQGADVGFRGEAESEFRLKCHAC